LKVFGSTSVTSDPSLGEATPQSSDLVHFFHFSDKARSLINFRLRWKSDRAADIAPVIGFGPEAHEADARGSPTEVAITGPQWEHVAFQNFRRDTTFSTCSLTLMETDRVPPSEQGRVPDGTQEQSERAALEPRRIRSISRPSSSPARQGVTGRWLLGQYRADTR
jgi:hypothetical protein